VPQKVIPVPRLLPADLPCGYRALQTEATSLPLSTENCHTENHRKPISCRYKSLDDTDRAAALWRFQTGCACGENPRS
jgi:hypothetical protein